MSGAVLRRAVGVARLRDAAAEQLGVLRLADDDLGFGPLLREHPRRRPLSVPPVP